MGRRGENVNEMRIGVGLVSKRRGGITVRISGDMSNARREYVMRQQGWIGSQSAMILYIFRWNVYSI